MSESETTDPEATEEGGKKGKKGKKDKGGGGKSNLLPAIVLAIGMLGGGYFMGPGAGTAEGGEAGPTTTEAVPPGEIATVEPININLADGHFLRVGMGLQLIETVDKAEFEKGETAKATDLIIAELAGSDMAEISTAQGREKVKKELKEKLEEVYEGEVTDVFFTDFVMQ